MANKQDLSYTILAFETSLGSTRERAIDLPDHLDPKGAWTIVIQDQGSYASYGLRWTDSIDYSQVVQIKLSLFDSRNNPSASVTTHHLLNDLKAQKAGEKMFQGPSGSGSVYTHTYSYIAKLELRLPAEATPRREASSAAQRMAINFAPTLLSSTPSDVRLYFPLSDLELWTNSATLIKASPYFQTLLSSEFAEGQKKTLTPKTTAKQGEWRNTSGFEDSDDELDSALVHKSKASKSKSTAGEEHHHPFHEISITDTAFATYQACLVWIATGYISFAPLSSTHTLKQPAGTSKPTKKSSLDLSAPQRSSPKSIYRLAHLLSLTELQTLALKSIASQLTINNVAVELFSDITSVYDEIAEVVVAFAATNWAGVKQSSAMKDLDAEVDKGEIEFSSKVSMKLMKLL